MDSFKLVLTAFTFVLFGCSQSKPALKSHDLGSKEAVWQPFRSSEGQCSIMLPGQALDESLSPTSRIFGVELEGGLAFLIAWSETKEELTEAGPEAVLSKARDSVAKSGRILRTTPMTVCGRPAQEVVAVDPDDIVSHIRHIVVDKRLYQLIYISPNSSYEPTDKDLLAFLGSFQLTE